jgi:hypothetical protein
LYTLLIFHSLHLVLFLFLILLTLSFSSPCSFCFSSMSWFV